MLLLKGIQTIRKDACTSLYRQQECGDGTSSGVSPFTSAAVTSAEQDTRYSSSCQARVPARGRARGGGMDQSREPMGAHVTVVSCGRQLLLLRAVAVSCCRELLLLLLLLLLGRESPAPAPAAEGTSRTRPFPCSPPLWQHLRRPEGLLPRPLPCTRPGGAWSPIRPSPPTPHNTRIQTIDYTQCDVM